MPNLHGAFLVGHDERDRSYAAWTDGRSRPDQTSSGHTESWAAIGSCGRGFGHRNATVGQRRRPGGGVCHRRDIAGATIKHDVVTSRGAAGPWAGRGRAASRT